MIKVKIDAKLEEFKGVDPISKKIEFGKKIVG